MEPVNRNTHTQPFNGPFPGLPVWAGTRKVKPIRILLKQETVSGSGISWAVCKSAPHSRQITTPAPHHSVFYRPDALPAAQPTASKHWRQYQSTENSKKKLITKTMYADKNEQGQRSMEKHTDNWCLTQCRGILHIIIKNTCVFKQICFWYLHH